VTQHVLEPTVDTTTDVLSRALPPVLTVDPGDSVVVRTLDASGHLERQRTPGETRPAMHTERRGHCLAGPICVRGAAPGMVLGVHLVSLRPDDWGFTVAGGRDTPLNEALGVADSEPAWLLWELDAERSVGTNDRGHTVALAPFLGVIGMPPDEPGEHSTTPPRPMGGGNIDCRDLVAGSTLYLPVTVPGALLCLGDGHAAQGDGEVGGTAIECGMTTHVELTLATDRPVPTVHAETPTSWITFGFDPDLNQAMVSALDAMLGWIGAAYSLEKAEALALASTTVDLRVTQVANQTWGVHTVLRRDAVR
jgi:acetamidase/formamidase